MPRQVSRTPAGRKSFDYQECQKAGGPQASEAMQGAFVKS